MYLKSPVYVDGLKVRNPRAKYMFVLEEDLTKEGGEKKVEETEVVKLKREKRDLVEYVLATLAELKWTGE